MHEAVLVADQAEVVQAPVAPVVVLVWVVSQVVDQAVLVVPADLLPCSQVKSCLTS